MNHIGDTNEMISDTPRTDKEVFFPPESKYNICDADFARTLERELNRACEMYRKLDIHTLNLVDRIMRMEKAGDAMEKLLPEGSICDKAAIRWIKTKKDEL